MKSLYESYYERRKRPSSPALSGLMLGVCFYVGRCPTLYNRRLSALMKEKATRKPEKDDM